MKSPCPFVNYLEIEEVARENGTSRLVMPFREELTNPVGFMHGGAISSLADAGMAEALVSLLRHGNFFTAKMEVRFKAPSKGETLICEAKIESSRGNFFFGKATVTGEKEGKVVAEAQATFRAAEQR
jgi:acyl-CoA thioesterase